MYDVNWVKMFIYGLVALNVLLVITAGQVYTEVKKIRKILEGKHGKV